MNIRNKPLDMTLKDTCWGEDSEVFDGASIIQPQFVDVATGKLDKRAKSGQYICRGKKRKASVDFFSLITRSRACM